MAAREYRPCPVCETPAVVVARLHFQTEQADDAIEHVYCRSCRTTQERPPVCRTRPVLHLGGFLVARVECRVCPYRAVVTHPYGPDVTNLRCPRCQHHTVEVVGWDV